MWAASGAMYLTGEADGPPLAQPASPAVCAARAIGALRTLTGGCIPEDVDGPALLGERAAILGLERRGRVSPSGTCRILRAADDWIAVNLPREDDLTLLPAWLGSNMGGDPWDFVAERIAEHPAADVVGRGRMLGLATARVGEFGPQTLFPGRGPGSGADGRCETVRSLLAPLRCATQRKAGTATDPGRDSRVGVATRGDTIEAPAGDAFGEWLRHAETWLRVAAFGEPAPAGGPAAAGKPAADNEPAAKLANSTLRDWPAPDAACLHPPGERRPLVVDLSALWAGPLCCHLLQIAGARVIKVESTRRPDGARKGPAEFYDLLNAGKESVALDFHDPNHLDVLQQLIEYADIVVEASRPRALVQLGIDAGALVERRPGLVWVSITGYGRGDPEGNWCAFGDDAAVAGGLVSGGRERPLFCADAVADPLTGMHAAAAAVAAWRAGIACLLDIALARVAAYVAACNRPRGLTGASRAGRSSGSLPGGMRSADPAGHSAEAALHPNIGRAARDAQARGSEPLVAPPHARRPVARARPLGADTDAVLRELERRRKGPC